MMPTRSPTKEQQQWYRCKGCGEPCVVFTDPSDGQRKVGHTKPKELIGIPNRVPCRLFRECETLEFFFRKIAGERLEVPDTFEPVLG